MRQSKSCHTIVIWTSWDAFPKRKIGSESLVNVGNIFVRRWYTISNKYVFLFHFRAMLSHERYVFLDILRLLDLIKHPNCREFSRDLVCHFKWRHRGTKKKLDTVRANEKWKNTRLLSDKTCLDTKPVLYQDRFCSLTHVWLCSHNFSADGLTSLG